MTMNPLIKEQREKVILSYLYENEPEYAVAINEFVEQNPQFKPYLYLIPKNYKPPVPKEVTSVKHCIIYYICNTGVRASFSQKLFKNIFNSHYTLKNDIEKTLIFVNKSKKESIKQALLLPEDFSIESFKQNKIQGIGVSGFCFLLSSFSPFYEIKNLTSYTDIVFCKGLQKIYNLSKRPSSSEAKKIVDTWKTEHKFIGNLLCFQVFHYHKD